MDWDLPLTRLVSVSGSFHRGRAIADIGGGLGQNVGVYLLSNTLPLEVSPDASLPAILKGLGSMGGSIQLKAKPGRRFEINVAAGQESRIASEVESDSSTQSYFDENLARNRTYMTNIIFRPRSNLLLSTEYRHIRTFSLGEEQRTADHINLAVGILF